MSIDDIAGAYMIEGQTVCRKCITPEELDKVTEKYVISRQEIENREAWLCDRCAQQL